MPVALGLATFFLALPVKLVTYNFSHCDSASVLLYLAGRERICSPLASFFLHSLQVELKEMMSISRLEAEIVNLKIDTENVIQFYTNRTGVDSDIWRERLSDSGTSISSRDSFILGMSTSVKSVSIEKSQLETI